MTAILQTSRRLPVAILCALGTLGGELRGSPIRPSVQLDGGPVSEQTDHVAETMLVHQRENGGWPKGYSRDGELDPQERQQILARKQHADTTFDNGATHSEAKHLARAYSNTGNREYRIAFLKAVKFMLAAQYENGGWPQQYPNPRGYAQHITFNDGAMIGVMTVLRDIAEGKKEYAFLDDNFRASCAEAVARGITCILECQIEVADRHTAWCAQHDHVNYAPRKARSYELPSISGSESVGVVRFLMDVDRPAPEIVDAIQGAVAWFDDAKLMGMRKVRKVDNTAPKGWDTIVIRDPDAPPIWARFYGIGTNKPIFCSRDGIPRDTLAEISYERRNGYSWLGDAPSDLLTNDYPRWQRRWAPAENVLRHSAVESSD